MFTQNLNKNVECGVWSHSSAVREAVQKNLEIIRLKKCKKKLPKNHFLEIFFIKKNLFCSGTFSR